MAKLIEFNGYDALTVSECAKICDKTPQTIYRYQKEGFPPAYQRLCELYASGRIMPLKWRYVRFNTKGNLQTDNGEIDEKELLSIPNTRSLLYSLRSIVEKQQKQISKLRLHVNNATLDAANDFYRQL